MKYDNRFRNYLSVFTKITINYCIKWWRYFLFFDQSWFALIEINLLSQQFIKHFQNADLKYFHCGIQLNCRWFFLNELRLLTPSPPRLHPLFSTPLFEWIKHINFNYAPHDFVHNLNWVDSAGSLRLGKTWNSQIYTPLYIHDRISMYFVKKKKQNSQSTSL